MNYRGTRFWPTPIWLLMVFESGVFGPQISLKIRILIRELIISQWIWGQFSDKAIHIAHYVLCLRDFGAYWGRKWFFMILNVPYVPCCPVCLSPFTCHQVHHCRSTLRADFHCRTARSNWRDVSQPSGEILQWSNPSLRRFRLYSIIIYYIIMT